MYILFQIIIVHGALKHDILAQRILAKKFGDLIY